MSNSFKGLPEKSSFASSSSILEPKYLSNSVNRSIKGQSSPANDVSGKSLRSEVRIPDKSLPRKYPLPIQFNSSHKRLTQRAKRSSVKSIKAPEESTVLKPPRSSSKNITKILSRSLKRIKDARVQKEKEEKEKHALHEMKRQSVRDLNQEVRKNNSKKFKQQVFKPKNAWGVDQRKHEWDTKTHEFINEVRERKRETRKKSLSSGKERIGLTAHVNTKKKPPKKPKEIPKKPIKSENKKILHKIVPKKPKMMKKKKKRNKKPPVEEEVFLTQPTDRYDILSVCKIQALVRGFLTRRRLKKERFREEDEEVCHIIGFSFDDSQTEICEEPIDTESSFDINASFNNFTANQLYSIESNSSEFAPPCVYIEPLDFSDTSSRLSPVTVKHLSPEQKSREIRDIQEIPERPSAPVSEFESEEVIHNFQDLFMTDQHFKVDFYIDRLFKACKLKVNEINNNLRTPLVRDPLNTLNKMQTSDIGVVVQPDFEVYPEIISSDVFMTLEAIIEQMDSSTIDPTLKDVRKIIHRMIFDAVNQDLQAYRPYGVKGTPLPWTPGVVQRPQFTFSQVESLVKQRVCEISDNKPEEIASLRDYDWIDYEFEEGQTVIDTADMVLDELITEFIFVL